MNKKYMKAALAAARQGAERGEVPVGAAVVLKGEIIATAHNRCEELKDPTAHAEVLAIREATKKLGNFRLKGAELYVTLEPCPMCVGAIINARIGEVVFGAFDPKKGALGSVCNLLYYDFPNKPEVFGGIDEKAGLELLREFFKEKR